MRVIKSFVMVVSSKLTKWSSKMQFLRACEFHWIDAFFASATLSAFVWAEIALNVELRKKERKVRKKERKKELRKKEKERKKRNKEGKKRNKEKKRKERKKERNEMKWNEMKWKERKKERWKKERKKRKEKKVRERIKLVWFWVFHSVYSYPQGS